MRKSMSTFSEFQANKKQKKQTFEYTKTTNKAW